MDDDALRRNMAAAICTVLEEGLRRAEDPITYLRSTAEEVRQLIGLFDDANPGSPQEGARIRALLLSEVEAATQELMRRLHH